MPRRSPRPKAPNATRLERGVYADITGAERRISISGRGGSVSKLDDARRRVVFGTEYNVLLDDFQVDVKHPGGTFTVYLPVAALTLNRRVRVLDASGNAGTNNITVKANGGETVNHVAGSTGVAISTNGGMKTFRSDGVNWLEE